MHPSTILRCSADDGCDESTIKRFAVLNHHGRASECHYCAGCAELARMDWNGETRQCVGPLSDGDCMNCSAVVGEPVAAENCSSLTHAEARK